MKKEEHNARFRDHYIAIGIRISYFRKLRGQGRWFTDCIAYYRNTGR